MLYGKVAPPEDEQAGLFFCPFFVTQIDDICRMIYNNITNF